MSRAFTRNARISHASHLVPLARAFDLSHGDVLELGMGWYSTSLLKWLCGVAGRELFSYDDVTEWTLPGRHRQPAYHHVICVSDWEAAPIEVPWGLAFVDHAPPERRAVEVQRLAPWAEYIVIHDTQLDKASFQYGYDAIWPLFKYRYDYTRLSPQTTIVSNFHSLERMD